MQVKWCFIAKYQTYIFEVTIFVCAFNMSGCVFCVNKSLLSFVVVKFVFAQPEEVHSCVCHDCLLIITIKSNYGLYKIYILTHFVVAFKQGCQPGSKFRNRKNCNQRGLRLCKYLVNFNAHMLHVLVARMR